MTSYILPPASLPIFAAEGFFFEDEDCFATVVRARGPRRRRRLWTGMPRAHTFRWTLTSAQMADLHDWFENVLLGGERSWNAVVRTEEGLRFWEVAFVEQYELDSEPTPRGPMWHVSGTLLSIGEPMVDSPDQPYLAAEYGLALEATATVEGSVTLAAEYGLALEVVTTLAAEYGLALEVFVPEFLATEDGQGFVLEDGSTGIQLEDGT